MSSSNNFSSIKPPTDTELWVDATLSQAGNYAVIIGGLINRTAHLNGVNPAGGNIAYMDGHASWREFKLMVNTFGNPQFQF